MEELTKLEKLKKIQEAYYMLIPCIKNNVIDDYENVITLSPIYLKEIIAEEEQSIKQ